MGLNRKMVRLLKTNIKNEPVVEAKARKGFVKMMDQQTDSILRQDVANVQKDINILEGDSISQLNDGFEKITRDTKETVIAATTAAKKNVGEVASQYNAKAQEMAEKIPGDFAKNVARFPWVAISIALVLGYLIGNSRKHA